MKFLRLMLPIFIVIFGCSTQQHVRPEQSASEKEFIETPRKVKTADQSLPYPYIHINGFKDYEIIQSNLIKSKTSKFAIFLRFNATYSSFYTKNVMYNAFGKWDEEFRLSGEKHPALIWNNVKLFENDNRLFKVLATGFENTKGSGNQVRDRSNAKQVKGSNHSIYSAVIVLDADGNDCLLDVNSSLKNKIIEYFSDGIKKLNSDNEFYKVYWDMVRNGTKRKKKKN